MLEKLRKNFHFFILILSFAFFAGAVYFVQCGPGEEGFMTSQEAADRALGFINENMLQEGTEASLMGVVEESGLYRVDIKVAEDEFETYVSKNGELLFINGINMREVEEELQKEKEAQTPEQTERPEVKLFVMSYCPYGLQAQKALLPVYDLLKDKADIGIYFVDYIMHDKAEIDENLRQYCIQKEQKDKFSAYLNCFVVSGDSTSCLSQTGIDTGALNSCVSAADNEFGVTAGYNDESTWLSGVYPRFNIHTDLNQTYGVTGSPTLVINGKIVSPSSRSPEAFKELICQAFSSQPEECSQVLSQDSASTGFGSGTSDSSSGSCE